MSTNGNHRKFRVESLESRNLLTASPIAQAVAQLQADAVSINSHFSTSQTNINADQQGLLYVVRQLDSDNFRQISFANSTGQTQTAVSEMTTRSTIYAAETRISSEFGTILTTLATAKNQFLSDNAKLQAAVLKGTVNPATAITTDLARVLVYKAAETTALASASTTDDAELPNLDSMTQQVEGTTGTASLGKFHGGFDMKSTINSVNYDLFGSATMQMTQSAHLLKATFTGTRATTCKVCTQPTTKQNQHPNPSSVAPCWPRPERLPTAWASKFMALSRSTWGPPPRCPPGR